MVGSGTHLLSLTFTLLLGRSIQNLPAIVRGTQVLPCKPALVPDVKIPGTQREWTRWPHVSKESQNWEATEADQGLGAYLA
jgi:hypothetical protein